MAPVESEAEKARKILAAKAGKRKANDSKELKWFFGGIDEKKLDIILSIVCVALAAYFSADRVDWEGRFYPRPLEKSITFVGNKSSVDGASVSKATEILSFCTSDAAAAATSTAKNSRNSTLIFFHSELLDGSEALRVSNFNRSKAKAFGLASSVDPEGVTPGATLEYIHRHAVAVMWIRPDWQREATESQFRYFETSPILVTIGQLKSVGSQADGTRYAVTGNASLLTDYFIWRGVYESDLDDFDSSTLREVAIQILSPASFYYRRNHIVAHQSAPISLHVDLSYFIKHDHVLKLLEETGLDVSTRSYLRSFVGGQFCLSERRDASLAVANVKAVRSVLTNIFASSVWLTLPVDTFIEHCRPSFPAFCSHRNPGKAWMEFYAVAANPMLGLNKTHKAILQTFGMPIGLGSSFAPKSASDLQATLQEGVSSFKAFLSAVNLPKHLVELVTISDSWVERRYDATLASRVHLALVESLQLPVKSSNPVGAPPCWDETVKNYPSSFIVKKRALYFEKIQKSQQESPASG